MKNPNSNITIPIIPNMQKIAASTKRIGAKQIPQETEINPTDFNASIVKVMPPPIIIDIAKSKPKNSSII